MSFNLNNVTIAGNLTRDPEMRTAGNADVCEFGIAINRRWKDKASGETREDVTFVDCQAWGRQAELVAQYLKKGSPVYLEGRLKLDQWEDKETGAKRSKLRVVADSVQFLPDGKRDTGGPEGDAEPRPARAAGKRPAPQDDDSEPPF